jgi:hypothetical protein
VALPRTLRRLLPLWAALAVTGPANAQDLLRVTAGRENESRPITLAADEITTWPANGEQIILLRGKVLIEQGVFNVRAERAVLWVDTARQPNDKLYRVQLVVDGTVKVEDGTVHKKAATANAELATKLDVKLRQGAKSAQKSLATDPFFVRAQDLRPRPASPSTGVQLTAAAAPATPAQNSPAPAPPPQPNLAPLPTVPLPAVVPGVTNQVAGPAPPGVPPPPVRNIRFQRRSDQPFQAKTFTLPTGEKVGVITGGVICTVRDARGGVMLDVEADRAVVWFRGDTQQLFEQMKTAEGSSTHEAEIYLAGHVELRGAGTAAPGSPSANLAAQRVLKAEQVYYDMHRGVAVAVTADLQFRRPGVPDDIHLTADELVQVSQNKFEATKAHVFASHLPSDPGLQVIFAHVTVEENKIERRGLLGQPIVNHRSGETETYVQRLINGENVTFNLEGVPIFYLPVVQGDANDPFGPLHSIAFRNDRIFGAQFYSDFNVWNLLNRDPLPGTRWTADLNEFTKRGPSAGTQFEYTGKDMFGLDGPYTGRVKLFGIYDQGQDILGGGRGEFDQHPLWRGRVLWDHNQTIDEEYTFQGRLSLLSDKNFLEQYYKIEFDTDINNETYQYFREQKDQWAWTIWSKEHVRNWVTEDVWLPRVDGYLLGQSFFDKFTYNAWGNAGYAELRPTSLPPPPWPPQQPTDKNNETGRFDLVQELSLPFYLGPVKVVPYGVLDLTEYTHDLNGDAEGRVLGGGGVRASLPLSRLYPNVESELFNLNGLYHKMVFSSNWTVLQSNEPHTNFAQIDRLNDDATDQALRDIYPRQPFLNPGNGIFLATSPIFDPQLYAIRQLIDNRVDTRDSIDEVQLDLRQRWQTKRGFPGLEHTVDYFTLDTSVSLFPDADRDNFGKSWAFAQYDATWNAGDRTAVTSTGWVDPFDHGARVFTIGATMNRPDRTNLFVGFRYIDPVDSRAVITSISYVFSPKYAITASSVYDFGTNQGLSNSLIITRIGSDLTMNIGFTYNAILNNFGFQFEILPNIAAISHRPGSGLGGANLR